jgi:hypothetical protein
MRLDGGETIELFKVVSRHRFPKGGTMSTSKPWPSKPVLHNNCRGLSVAVEVHRDLIRVRIERQRSPASANIGVNGRRKRSRPSDDAQSAAA